MIQDAAAAILRRAAPRPHPAAEASGHGPCLIAADGSVETRGRPTQSFSGPVGRGGARAQFQAAAYHVTWVAHHQRPPPDTVGLTYSHLCNEKRCVEARHGHWEDAATNASRERCRSEAACSHIPRCFV
jgi:hypothetical protein